MVNQIAEAMCRTGAEMFEKAGVGEKRMHADLEAIQAQIAILNHNVGTLQAQLAPRSAKEKIGQSYGPFDESVTEEAAQAAAGAVASPLHWSDITRPECPHCEQEILAIIWTAYGNPAKAMVVACGHCRTALGASAPPIKILNPHLQKHG